MSRCKAMMAGGRRSSAGVRARRSAIALFVVAAALQPLGSGLLDSLGVGATARPLAVEPGDIRLAEPTYAVVADPRTGVVHVGSTGGLEIAAFPLTALIGSAGLPAGATVRLREQARSFIADTRRADGTLLVEAVMTPGPLGIAVRFTAVPGDPGGGTVFFSDGRTGLAPPDPLETFTPDTAQPPSAAPAVATAGRTPLAPAPLDVEVGNSAGWLGVGLVEVPDATRLAILPRGGVAVDYPLRLLDQAADNGGGGRCGAMVCFPRFVLTVASTPLLGLTAYHDAVVALGAAPTITAPPPSWWEQPMVDTWGQQLAEGVQRGSPAYTATWVRAFAEGWRTRGLAGATVVIDSRWQAQIGEAAPDPVRFGGATGMRALIDQLHAEGMHVVLWWPLWGHRVAHVPPARADMTGAVPGSVIDPTSPGFDASMAATVRTLLGSGPGDLDADGLKLDWGYDIPSVLQNPAVAVGDAALLHYMTVIHDVAHLVRPEALVDSSAAAPQFAGTTDAVRLYDAWSQADWDRRAAVVSAADPGRLIDGDGWQTTSSDAAAHLVASTVFGIPAFYYGTLWSSGRPIDAATARLVVTVMSLAAGKGGGTAEWTGTDWRFVGIGGEVRAESLGGERAVVLWGAAGGAGGDTGRVVATVAGEYTVPVRRGPAYRAIDAAGRVVTIRQVPGGVRLSLSPASPVTLVPHAG